MKTTILLTLFLLLVSQFSHGQKFSYENKDSDEFINSISRFDKTDTVFRLLPNLDLFHRRNHSNSDLGIDNSFRNIVIVRSEPPNYFEEEFPGASKYYAKNPSLFHMPGEEKFILKPETESKYYLLIKDPKDNLHGGK